MLHHFKSNVMFINEAFIERNTVQIVQYKIRIYMGTKSRNM